MMVRFFLEALLFPESFVRRDPGQGQFTLPQGLSAESPEQVREWTSALLGTLLLVSAVALGTMTLTAVLLGSPGLIGIVCAVVVLATLMSLGMGLLYPLLAIWQFHVMYLLPACWPVARFVTGEMGLLEGLLCFFVLGLASGAFSYLSQALEPGDSEPLSPGWAGLLNIMIWTVPLSVATYLELQPQLTLVWIGVIVLGGPGSCLLAHYAAYKEILPGLRRGLADEINLPGERGNEGDAHGP